MNVEYYQTQDELDELYSHPRTCSCPQCNGEPPGEGEEKKRIRPHKGGRSSHFLRSRITPDARKKLNEILERRGISAADWVTEKIEQEYERINPPE